MPLLEFSLPTDRQTGNKKKSAIRGAETIYLTCSLMWSETSEKC